ncbi:MAG: hypothetical protein ABSG87_09105 [Verrucomicrobiota bacterium]|jgi:hypothetical protein
MKIGIIGEGQTEFYCLPTLVAKFNHTIVGVHHLHGVGATHAWDKVVCLKFYPYVRAFAKKSSVNKPDNVLIVVDRETRPQCCPELADQAVARLQSLRGADGLMMPVAVVIPNPKFECWLLANPQILDNSPLFKKPISSAIGNQTDGKNIDALIKRHLKADEKWIKHVYGKKLAQKLDLNDKTTLKRSRSLRKFVKELTCLN